jgi:hypothetical protein
VVITSNTRQINGSRRPDRLTTGPSPCADAIPAVSHACCFPVPKRCRLKEGYGERGHHGR